MRETYIPTIESDFSEKHPDNHMNQSWPTSSWRQATSILHLIAYFLNFLALWGSFFLILKYPGYLLMSLKIGLGIFDLGNQQSGFRLGKAAGYLPLRFFFLTFPHR
jgi:hypothetical protein